MTALSAGRHRFGPHPFPELDYRDKAIAARPVPFLRPRIRPRSERCQASPISADVKPTAMLGSLSLNGCTMIARQTLKSIDLAPRRLPAAEVRLEFIGCLG